MGENSTTEALCHDPSHTPRWGMVIDVNRCVGCQTCTIACKHWNDTLPDIQWRSVIDIEQGEYPDVQRQFLVVGCQHCEEPPCVPVCPTGATKQRADGLVTMDYDVCIGCGYCAVACPYQARTIAHDMHGYYDGHDLTQQEEAVFDQDRIGVAQKCTFCKDRVDDGLAQGLTPGVDLEATPACSAACIASAITFGDYNDPGSEVSKLTADSQYFQMHEELGTNPQIKYLYTTPAVPARDGETAQVANAQHAENMSDPENPLVGKRQTFWDWRAAMNWCFGGLASGAAALAWILYLVTDLPEPVLAWFNFGVGGLMGVGLFFVFLKIGRKLRFWRAITRFQTSWMTRELYVVPVFGAGVLAGLFSQHPAAFAVTGLAALAFLFCQAMILFKARGIPNWRVPLVPWMIVATGLLEGAGLVCAAGGVMVWVMLNQEGGELILAATIGAMQWAAGAGLLLAVINAGLWHRYRTTAQARGIPPLSRAVLNGMSIPLHLVGHALPVVAFALALFALSMATPIAYIIGGLAAAAGGFLWKFTIIVRASYQQGFAMPMVPARGSGSRAAPPRLDGFASRPEQMQAAE